jgi:hypothetical protein
MPDRTELTRAGVSPDLQAANTPGDFSAESGRVCPKHGIQKRAFAFMSNNSSA